MYNRHRLVGKREIFDICYISVSLIKGARSKGELTGEARGRKQLFCPFFMITRTCISMNVGKQANKINTNN